VTSDCVHFNPGFGDVAVVDDVKTISSVITGARTTVITPVLEESVDAEFYNFRSRAPALEVFYDDYEVEPNNGGDTSFGRSTAVSKPAPSTRLADEPPKKLAASVPAKKNSAQEDLLTRLRKNREKFEKLTAGKGDTYLQLSNYDAKLRSNKYIPFCSRFSLFLEVLCLLLPICSPDSVKMTSYYIIYDRFPKFNTIKTSSPYLSTDLMIFCFILYTNRFFYDAFQI
jgi:hypothetical protein